MVIKIRAITIVIFLVDTLMFGVGRHGRDVGNFMIKISKVGERINIYLN